MAIVHVNGFGTMPVTGDAVTLGNASNGTSVWSRQAGRYGGYALRHTNSNNTTSSYIGRLRLPTQYPDFSLGFALNHRTQHVADPTMVGIVLYSSSVSYIWEIGLGCGYLNTYAAPSGASAWTVADASVIGIGWHWYNFIFKWHATAGLCQLWRDGTMLAQTGVDTVPAGGTSLYSQLSIFLGNAGTGTQSVDLGDLIFRNDNVAIPDSVVTSLFPDGTSAGAWIGSDGDSTNNHLLVNENPTYDAATYVGSGTLNATDTYTMSNLPNTASSVSAVQIGVRAFKSDAGARTMAAQINGVSGTAKDPGGGSTIYEITTTNPSGGAAWDTTSVNAMTTGVRVMN